MSEFTSYFGCPPFYLGAALFDWSPKMKYGPVGNSSLERTSIVPGMESVGLGY